MFSQFSFPSSWLKYLIYLVGVLLIASAVWFFTRPALPVVPLVKVERGLVEATVSNTRAGARSVRRQADRSRTCW